MNYYNESEILKTIQHPNSVFNKQEFINEDKQGCLKYGSKVFATVINSIPMYSRMEDEHESDEQWVTLRLCDVSSILENGRYERVCPKVMWGFAAYLIASANKITSIAGTERITVDRDKAYKDYYNICYRIYRACNRDVYNCCELDKDIVTIESMDVEFLRNHIDSEKKLWQRSQQLDNPLLSIADFDKKVNGYFVFLNEEERDKQKKATMVQSPKNEDAKESLVYDKAIVSRIYQFCMDTKTFNIEINTLFSAIDDADFKSIYKDKETTVAKCAYLIYCLAKLIDEKQQMKWYREAANSIGQTPSYCSGRSNSIPEDWKKELGEIK